MLRGRSIEISGSPAVPMGGDGEPLGRLPSREAVLTGHVPPARIDVLPAALTLLT